MKSFTPNTVKLTIIISVACMLIIDTLLILSDDQNLLNTAGAATWVFPTLFLLPLSILYFSFKDYTLSIKNGEVLGFLRSFGKGVLISIVFGIVSVFLSSIINGKEYGLESLITILILPLNLIIGLVLQLIFTTFFYFRSYKKRTDALKKY